MADVRGLTHFTEHFRDWQEHYVLIGGVASSLAMDEAGQDFRKTKDLDIVLIVEALSADFIAHFWDFIKAGRYRIKQRGGDAPCFYRFDKPENPEFPMQLELFSRLADGLDIDKQKEFTFITAEEALSNLSAILLDEVYYTFLLEGRQHSNDLVFINADRLIPFKARAWLDLSQRERAGEKIDSKDIRKHRNDVLVLSRLLTGDPITLPAAILQDMRHFLMLLAEEEIKMKDLKIAASLPTLIERMQNVFGINAEILPVK